MPTQYIICGFGRLGQAVAKASLAQRSARDITVVERDFGRSQNARARGFRAICGDATDIRTLRVAHVGAAGDVIICVDERGGSDVVQLARALAPSARIQVGAYGPDHRDALVAAGADAVVIVSKIAGELLADSLNV